jgi:hypothetical protein
VERRRPARLQSCRRGGVRTGRNLGDGVVVIDRGEGGRVFVGGVGPGVPLAETI